MDKLQPCSESSDTFTSSPSKLETGRAFLKEVAWCPVRLDMLPSYSVAVALKRLFNAFFCCFSFPPKKTTNPSLPIPSHRRRWEQRFRCDCLRHSFRLESSAPKHAVTHAHQQALVRTWSHGVDAHLGDELRHAAAATTARLLIRIPFLTVKHKNDKKHRRQKGQCLSMAVSAG